LTSFGGKNLFLRPAYPKPILPSYY